MQTAKKVLHVLVNVILWLLIIIIAFFSVVTFSQKGKGGVAKLFGFTPMTVLSDSMAPTFHANDLIIVREGDTAGYHEGDIISFWTVIENQKAINTHRIVEVYQAENMTQYVTKGDANAITDAYVVASGDVIGGYVCTIPFLGRVLNLLSTSTGFLVVIVLPILAFFLYQLYRFILLLIEIKRQTVMEATKAAMAEMEQQRQAAPAGGGDDQAEDKTEP